jgi:aryl-alcohol dehydrogenase-like predicted oxidoreductase
MQHVTFPVGLTVSKIGYGAMGMTAFYGPPMPHAEAHALLKEIHQRGITHFDTAEVYKSGEYGNLNDGEFNESLLGEFFKTIPDRKSFTIATKWGPTGKVTREEFEFHFFGSLKRLGLEYVDLYYCHRMPATVEDLEEWMRAGKALVEAGKIKYLGLSEVGPEWLRRAHAIHPVAVIQQEWSVCTRGLESALIPVCKELGIGVVAYSPLARNLLTLPADAKPPQDWRASNPRYQGDAFEKNKQIAAEIAALGAKNNHTNAQLLLAWLYRRAEELGIAMVPIPGSTKLQNVLGNIASTTITLSDEDYATLTRLGEEVVGARKNDKYVGKVLEDQLTQQ